MAEGHLASIATHFEHLTDPRVERTRAHNLLDILTIAICAILCGAEGPTGMETFGQAKEAWLRMILPLPNGIPSHDTFSRVLAQLNPAELQAGFPAWFAAIQTAIEGELIAVDGKTLRKSAAKAWGKAAIQMVSAWAIVCIPAGATHGRSGMFLARWNGAHPPAASVGQASRPPAAYQTLPIRIHLNYPSTFSEDVVQLFLTVFIR